MEYPTSLKDNIPTKLFDINRSCNITTEERVLKSFHPANHYQIDYGIFKFCKKFNTKGMDHKVMFRDLDKIPPNDLPMALEDIFIDIIKTVGDDMKPYDKVRFHMSSDSWRRDANMPYMSASDLTGKRVLAEIAKINQSNGNDQLTVEPMSLNIIHTMMPEPGSGWSQNGSCRNRIYTSLEKWLEIKKCTIKTINKDDLCFARSLVVAIAHHKHIHEPSTANAQELKYIRRSDKSHQTFMAKKIHKDACVPEGPCGMDEVQKFQDFVALLGYRIYIFSAEANFKAIYTGCDTCEKRLSFLLYNNHYVVITSTPAIFNASQFCWDCLKGVRDLTGHNCSKKCLSCHDLRCLKMPPYEKLKCDSCFRDFKGQECFKYHEENGICNTLQRCKSCLLMLEKGKVHNCGKLKCRFCKQYVEKGHLCYIQKPPVTHSPSEYKPSNSKNINGKRYLNDQNDNSKFKKKLKLNQTNEKLKVPITIYFDFEAMQDTGKHVPNLVIAQWTHNGHHEKVFKTNDKSNARDSFCNWIFHEHCGYADLKQPLLFVAHYFKGYDGYFILEYLYENAIFPEVIFTGCKIMMVNVEAQNIKFIDSFNFLPIPLDKFPATFELNDMKKGYFPHLFNTVSNQNYSGPMPPLSSYQPDSKSEEQRSKLIKWHSDEVAANRTFNFKKEIVDYCKSDVQILREGCDKFRKMLMQLFDHDPFIETLTIAAYCQRVYRTKFMPKDSIAIIPSDSYAGRNIQSSKAIRWLLWMQQCRNETIQHAKNGGEFKVGKYYVDGYCPVSNTVFEFNGCFHHGCSKCYSGNIKNPLLKCTMGDAYASTLSRAEYIRNLGYNLIEIWECEYEYQIKTNNVMQEFVQECKITDPLDVRDAFYGGRTCATRLHYKASADECIRYYDYVSLYPTINKYGKMPVGHPIVLKNPEKYIPNQHYGLVKCKVLPPSNLYHGVLPMRSRGRLLFPLCSACAEARQDSCGHSDDDRALEGTWISPELDQALLKGYKILHVHEIWHFEQTAEYNRDSKEYSNGLFGEYVNCLLKIKQEASGYPDHVIKENGQDAFINDYFKKEGILLEKKNIKPNPGLRTIAKLMLNSLWGKFGQSENLPTTEYVTELEQFIALLVSPEYIVTNAHIVNEEMMMVTYNRQKDFITPSGRTNLFIAAFTTGLARLKLYELLDTLQDNVLYMDTDSVIFKSPLNEDPLRHLLGDNLGKVTNEIASDDFIEEFVSGGPKNYGYRCKSGKEVWKVCGLTQNYKTRQLINFNVIKAMVTAAENAPEYIHFKDNEIVRNKFDGTLINKPCQKTYKIHFDKGIVDEHYVVFPFGYKK